MAQRDYYEVLGLSREASADDIKKAYRKLARELHPDVNDAADAQQKFSEVQEAYAVLSDDAKRAQYDRFGRSGVGASWSNKGGGGGGPHVEMDMEDLGSVFDAFFGGGGGHSEPFGGGFRGGRAGTRARPSPPREVERDFEVDFETAARGGKRSITIGHDSQSTSIDVTIPKGVKDGTKLRIRKAFDGADLILRIRIARHPLFKRDGLDLLLDLPLTIAEATLGAKVPVPTLEGPVDLTVPPGAKGGSRLRLKGRGVTDAKGATGALYAVVRIVTPPADDLSDDDKATLRRISESQGAVRTGQGWPQDAG